VSYTTLRVSERGVVLFEAHAERLGPQVREPFQRFAATAAEGIYSLRAESNKLRIERRAGTRLVEDAELRTTVSPVIGGQGPIPKPTPPSVYDAVRATGAMTLLISAAGDEIYESCLASVMAWDGQSLVLVPNERPRVRSLAEAFIAHRFPHRRAPIRVDGDWGLLLINAVAAVAPVRVPGRQPFPGELLHELRAAIEATAIR